MNSATKTLDFATAAKPASIHDSARGSPEPLDDFHSLIQDINTILGPCNGIDSAGVDVEELKKRMLEYDTNEDSETSWLKYAFRRGDKNYTRNLVDNCNGKSNLVSWPPSMQATSPRLYQSGRVMLVGNWLEFLGSCQAILASTKLQCMRPQWRPRNSLLTGT